MKARLSLVILAVLAACDSSGDRTASTFPDPDPLGSQISGRVRRGPEGLSGAVVTLAASPGTEAPAAPAGGNQDATNVSGFFRFSWAPRQYDLAIRYADDVVVYRDLLSRYVEPSFGEAAPSHAFTATLRPVVDPPTPAGRELVFFVAGQEAVDVTGDVASGLVVSVRSFGTDTAAPSPLVLHVVERAIGTSLAAATAYGRAPISVSVDQVSTVAVHMDPIATAATPSAITLAPPPGATASEIEIAMHFGVRTTAQVIARTTSGAPVRVVPVPNATYTMHARATTQGGGTSDTGLQGFDPTLASTVLQLPALPSPDASAVAGRQLSSGGEGVREHVLVAASGARYRAVTTAREVALADLARVVAAPPAGTYTWTVQHWPKLVRAEELSGPDARVTRDSATSAPLTITIP